MRRLKRYICLVGLLALLAAALTGCGFSDDSVEELFTLPRMAEEYTGLTQELETLITQGYEYASPTGGRNIQSVQMADLDGDGQQEALAFFRMSSDEKPLKIFVFKIEGGSYARYCTIESSGTAIDSVYYQDLNGDGRRELIVGWRISAEVQTVAVYTVAREPVAEFYGWQDEQMGVAYRCVLSSTMASVNRGSLVSGRLDADTPALYITGVDEQGMAATDILVFRQDLGLVNLALSGSSTGVSNAVFPYRQLLPQDINGDGIIELPSPDTSWTAEQTDGLVSWLCCNGDGQLSTVAKTYHSLSCGWYFTIPESWWDWSVETATTSISNENQFSLAINGDPVLSLYTITGENRENRGRMGKRVLLRRQTATIYAGELNDAAAYYGMDEDLLRRSFSLIVGSWSN